MTGDSQSSSAGKPTTSVIRIVEIVGVFLTVIGFLFYPIGLFVLSLQLWNTYPYDFSATWVTASLAPVTLVAGKTWDCLFGALVAMLAARRIGTLIAGHSSMDEYLARRMVESVPEKEREEFRARGKRLNRFSRLSSILEVVVLLAIPPVIYQDLFIFSWKSWVLYAVFVALSVIGGVIAGLLGHFDGSARGPLSTYWKTTAVAYVFGILAGITLSGAMNPSLPLVNFESATPKEGRLLAHTNGYWYVFDGQGTLVALQDAEVGDVKFAQNKN